MVRFIALMLETFEAIFSFLCSNLREKIFIISGQVVEYDEPMKLIKREGSLFGKLVKEYWSHLQSAESR